MLACTSYASPGAVAPAGSDASRARSSSRACRDLPRFVSIPTVTGCAPPSTRRAVRSTSSSVVAASRTSSSVAAGSCRSRDLRRARSGRARRAFLSRARRALLSRVHGACFSAPAAYLRAARAGSLFFGQLRFVCCGPRAASSRVFLTAVSLRSIRNADVSISHRHSLCPRFVSRWPRLAPKTLKLPSAKLLLKSHGSRDVWWLPIAPVRAVLTFEVESVPLAALPQNAEQKPAFVQSTSVSPD